MGYIRHHAIIVTSWKYALLEVARADALSRFGHVSEVVGSPVNGYRSFFVAPDGSKEGWDESAKGDLQRAEFTAWLNAQRYEDGSSALGWVEVFYGDDERAVGIVNDGDMRRRSTNSVARLDGETQP
jgi:hypothetical protein